MLVAVIAGSALTLGTAEAAAPPNDNFSQAEAITSLPYSQTVDVSSATAEYGEPNCTYLTSPTDQRTVWYAISPTQAKRIVVTGSSATMGVVLGVFSGPALKELTTEACNYSTQQGTGARAAWLPVVGKTYYVQVSGYGAARGSVGLHVEMPPPPSNDNRANAKVIPYPPAPYADVIEEDAGATSEPGEPAASCLNNQQSNGTVWYVLTTPANSHDDVEIDMIGSKGYPYAAVWKVRPDSSLQEIQCMNAAATRLLLAPASTYYFQLFDSLYWGYSGRLELHINAPLPNDDFSSAVVLPLDTTDTVDTQRATFENGEPRPSCVGGSRRTVWYQFTAPSDMVLGLQATTGDDNWPEGWIVAYKGASLESLQELACKSQDFTLGGVELRAGESVYLQAGAYYSNSSVVHTTISALPKRDNDDPESARAMSVIPGLNTSISEDSIAGRLSAGEPRPTCGPDDIGAAVWFSASFTTTETRIVSTQYSGYDTVLQIFDMATTALACNDDDSSLTPQSSMSFTFEAGKSYLIEVAGANRERGDLSLALYFPAPPPPPAPANDDFVNATQIGSLPYADIGTTSGATLQPNEPQPSAGCVATPTDPIVNNTIWYSFTPDHDTTLAMTVAGNTLNTLVAAYRGSSFPGLTQVACTGVVSAQGNNARVQVATFTVDAGITYYFQVGRRGTQNTGSAPFQLHEAPEPTP